MDTLYAALKSQDFITASQARSDGVSKHGFYKFVKDNGLERVGHGVYAPAGAWVDELSLLHMRCPSAVFSHDEAFFHHGLVDREPLLHTITVYSGFNAHRLEEPGGVRVYSVKRELLGLGKTKVDDSLGNPVPMYDLERTVCDALRSRNSIEAQDFASILKTYAARPDKDLNLLMEYAGMLRVRNVARRYLEVLL